MDNSTKIEKQLAIIEAVMHTANMVIDQVKKLPKGKHRKNVFIKSYNRRPGNKRKRARIISGIAMSQYMGAAQIIRIASTPTPKYKSGGK